jgi:hypothetical protein
VLRINILGVFTASVIVFGFSSAAVAVGEQHSSSEKKTVSQQRALLSSATQSKGFGPQSPRDLGSLQGNNKRSFGIAAPFHEMNLCNIHFHESAEHKGGEFTRYAGDGDGEGYGTGFKYSGTLSKQELSPVSLPIGKTRHGDLVPGDTIEIHFVFSSAQVSPGRTLGACLNESINNPNLRVETVVAVLVNDPSAISFRKLANISISNGRYQASNIPDNLGSPIVYAGSTTGPSYNEKGSPFQVTWSVRPKVLKVDILSLDAWLKNNIFGENHAHGVRNLIINPELLSPIR